MDPAFREIDEIIAIINSEKVGFNRPYSITPHPHGVDYLQIHHDVDDNGNEEDEFLNSILNEITCGDVSKLDIIDDHTVTAIFPPPPAPPVAREQQTTTTQVGIVNTITPTSHSLSALLNPPVLMSVEATNGTPPQTGKTITYQLPNGVPVPVVVASTLPNQSMDIAPPSIATSEKNVPVLEEVEVVETPGPSAGGGSFSIASFSSSRKRKLYEEDEFSDPMMEKKRQNAINAKRHRDTKKHTIQSLSDELKKVKEERDALKKVEEERDALKKENERLRKDQLQDHETLVIEAAELKKKNEAMGQKLQALEQQYQQSLQQTKIGIPNILDFQFDF